jgi:hypothetical protein
MIYDGLLLSEFNSMAECDICFFLFFVFLFLVCSLNSGKCECALFGGYVGGVKKKLEKSVAGLPIVVVQYAKIKIFRGNIF